MPLTFTQLCLDYLERLWAQRENPQATAELSLRAALDDLLTRAAQLVGQTVQFVGEGRLTEAGRPDFIVTAGGLPIGYIEAEKFGADLDHLTGHAKEQNTRFIKNLDNFLLTNHLEFRLYSNGALVAEAALPEPPSRGTPAITEPQAEKLLALLEQLMRAAPLPISAPRDLALHLSRRARQLRDTVREMFQNNEADEELTEDYEAFKQVLLPDLHAFLSDKERAKPKRPQSFDDLYAQTVAYGLFAARCGHGDGGSEKFTRRIAADYLGANPFLKKLFGRFTGDLNPALAWIVDDMAALLDNAPMGDIQQYFFKRTGRADPMIDFYEPFLRAYDANLRDVRGVYYTPEPVVGYIVRSLDVLLQRHFKLSDGLADASKVKVEKADGSTEEIHRVLLLDPATGTGSFLFAAIDHIHEKVNKRGTAAWAGYAKDHLLDRLFGFELLMAPYSIAHLKLGLQLAGKGTPIAARQRFGVYLTNTLDDAVKQSDLLMGRFISDEANAAVEIKKTSRSSSY